MKNSTYVISAVLRILTVVINLPLTAGFSYCPCVLFNSTGNFHSPNYPSDLKHINCLFYHFKAPKNNVVQITFTSFSLPIRNPTCVASVSIFDHSEDGLIDPKETPDFQYCGKEVKSGRQFYSRDEHLHLQIRHGDSSSKGFSGEYRFLPKQNFISDAIEINECSYKIEKTKGTLYSPQYPYFYPSLFNCSYILPQRKGFQTIISSGEIMLGKEALLYVTEINRGKSQILSLISSQSSLYLSSSALLQLYFQAGINHDRARGFVIEFTYEKSVWRSEETNVIGDCSLTITSSNEKSGNISSSSLNPKGSSLPTRCRISFQGFPNERVSIKFTYFNLYIPDNKNFTKRCADFDHLTANVRVGSRLSRIDEWCADKTPPQLMSNSNLLELEYMTKSSRLLRENAKNIGFRLQYRFHTDWNMQHMQAEIDKTKDCRFLFNSSNQSSGNLWSINYPGLYPRNVYCEYIFHGSDEEIVHIHFEYFDVEGFHQCDETTKSDFILFSNYQTHDRTNRRFCGQVAPKGPILSESNYFRMIFSTNDIFDATGFYAHYQFISQQKAQISRVKLTTSTASTRFISAATLLRIAQFLF